MTIQLDHIFVLVGPGAPEADALLSAGMLEGPANEHPGQGTANRRFFFTNFTLEFLFVHDLAEAMNGPAKGLKLVERAIDVAGSPFGLVSRVIQGVEIPNFPAWKYFPEYFAQDMCFFVGDNSDNFDEPLCICMPPALPKPKKAPAPSNSGWSLTELQISIPGSTASPALSAFGECDLVTIRYNEDHRMTLILNNASTGNIKNFMPDLPLVISW